MVSDGKSQSFKMSSESKILEMCWLRSDAEMQSGAAGHVSWTSDSPRGQ